MVFKVSTVCLFIASTLCSSIVAGPSVAYSAFPPFSYAAAPYRTLAAAPALAPAVAPAPVIRAAPLAAAPFAAPLAPVAKLDPVDSYPQYQYAYNIQDSLTGDSKAQEEIREGEIVKGRYSLIDPDGSRRTVDYYADPINGFNAIVQKELPVAAHPAVVAV